MSAATAGQRRLSVADLAAGVALTLAGIVIFVLTLDFRPAPSAGRDPSILPRAVAVVLAVCGLGITAAGLRGTRRPGSSEAPALATITAGQEQLAAYARADEATAGTDSTATVVEERPALGPVVALVTGIVVYSWLAMSVGYLTATVAFLVVTPILLAGRRDPRTLVTVALLAAGLTTLIYVGFVEFLRVPLPPTPLP